ncbi:hypothetical protein [Streptosporangium sp. NPDC020145]|uniref:hypothetical protein n=1 Tax=Streptosporangium sp. NPDC020145 TaxID=3154694 RepID=UPI0034490EC9
MSSAARHAQIIGAGLGGLTAAAALAQCGWIDALAGAAVRAGVEIVTGSPAVAAHTQRFSYRLGHLNPLPDRPRAALLAVMNRSRSLARMRMRAATTIPTGMNRFPA